jgi:hypothetical protein
LDVPNSSEELKPGVVVKDDMNSYRIVGGRVEIAYEYQVYDSNSWRLLQYAGCPMQQNIVQIFSWPLIFGCGPLLPTIGEGGSKVARGQRYATIRKAESIQ